MIPIQWDASAQAAASLRDKRGRVCRKPARRLTRWCSARSVARQFTLATVDSAGRTFSSQVASLRLTDCCCRVCLLAVVAGERRAPRNCLRCCRLRPPRTPTHGSDLACRSSHWPHHQSQAWLSANAIDGIQRPCIDQARPVSGPAADRHPGLSGFSLLSEGRQAFIARLVLLTWPSVASICSITCGTAIPPAGSSSST